MFLLAPILIIFLILKQYRRVLAIQMRSPIFRQAKQKSRRQPIHLSRISVTNDGKQSKPVLDIDFLEVPSSTTENCSSDTSSRRKP